MINHHHGNEFDFLPVYSVMALRRGTNTLLAMEILGRILASRMFTHRKRRVEFTHRSVLQGWWERRPTMSPFP